MESYGYLPAASRADLTAPVLKPSTAHVVTAHAVTAHSVTPEAGASHGQERRDSFPRHAAAGGENMPLSH
jgi:hypothetical protein